MWKSVKNLLTGGSGFAGLTRSLEKRPCIRRGKGGRRGCRLTSGSAWKILGKREPLEKSRKEKPLGWGGGMPVGGLLPSKEGGLAKKFPKGKTCNKTKMEGLRGEIVNCEVLNRLNPKKNKRPTSREKCPSKTWREKKRGSEKQSWDCEINPQGRGPRNKKKISQGGREGELSQGHDQKDF